MLVSLLRVLPRITNKKESRFGKEFLIPSHLKKWNFPILTSKSSFASQLIEAVPSGLLLVNIDNKIISCNSRIANLFGYPMDELMGMSLEALIPCGFHGNQLMSHWTHHQTGFEKQTIAVKENFGLTREGRLVPIEVETNSIQTEEGILILVSVVDNTEKKKIAKELLEGKMAADAANHAKSAFLANMSHEIRTPLGAMMGLVDLIIDPQIKSFEKTNLVSALKRNGELLSNIINDILDLSKIEAGKMQIDSKEVELSEFLTDTQTLLNLQAKEKGIVLKFHIAENVPRNIETDPLRLRQVLLNIVGNAIKFTSKGYVEVKIEYRSICKNQSQLSFIVKDTGHGISEKEKAKLFVPFSQADVTSKRKFGGTGLGLVLSRQFANLLGGNVELTQSIPRVGSIFTITINPKIIPNRRSQKSTKRGSSVVPLKNAMPLKGTKVLLADDSQDNQIVISRFLGLAGANVDSASNGLEAIDKAKRGRYDVILMDLQMPVMDGFEATAELRRDGYLGKIVALTAHTLADDRERCLKNGFDFHVGKPVNRNHLIEVVQGIH